jgi:hypothetical protein
MRDLLGVNAQGSQLLPNVGFRHAEVLHQEVDAPDF